MCANIYCVYILKYALHDVIRMQNNCVDSIISTTCHSIKITSRFQLLRAIKYQRTLWFF